MPRNGSLKVRRWPEGDRTAGAMASIAPGAASPYPTGIPHPSEPPTSSQPERWRLPWRRRQCQPSTGIRGFGEVREPIRYERRWASLLLWLSGTITPVSPVAVAFNGKAFLSSESGASALDARSNPMIVGPRPVTAGFAELGCKLLAQTSRVHALIGSGAKMGWCLTMLDVAPGSGRPLRAHIDVNTLNSCFKG